MTGSDDDIRERALARIGTSIKGKYRLDRLLGIGGMAVVFAATHRNGRPVALKLLHAELSLNGDIRTRFLREGHAANAVKHPGAVAVLDDDVADEGSAFLVMELLEGATVEEIWERHDRRLPLAAVLSIGVQLLDVLAAAHANGLVHRDIKPANVFLTTQGEIKVLDFGIARLRDVAASSATQTGLMMGTPAFMAPEQAMAVTSEIDAQSDLWAVGASLFTLASGQLVHDAANAQQLVIVTATQPARSFATAFPNAPPSVVEIIDRATAFEKSARWASGVAMRDALKNASTGAFGGLMTPAALGEILEEARELKTTLMTAPLAGSEPGVVATQPMGHTPARASAYRGAPIAELATAGPVSADPHLRGGRTKKRPPIELLVAGSVGTFVIVCGIVATIAVATRHSVASSGVASASASSAATSAEPAAFPAAEASAVAALQADVQDGGVQEISVDQLPAASSAPRATPNVAPAGKPAAPKTSCSPPYTIDALGKKHFKRECL
jgi:hypothetical protein